MNRRRKKIGNVLEIRNGNWYENGKYLPKKNYIFHASCHDGESITSCVTGQKYSLRHFTGRVVC